MPQKMLAVCEDLQCITDPIGQKTNLVIHMPGISYRCSRIGN